MKKRLAVLLLRLDGSPDQPSKAYAEQLFTGTGKGTRNLVDYYDEMSHGRLDLSDSRVFDWIDYGHTRQDVNDEWNKAKKEKKEELVKAGTSDADAETPAKIYANGVARGKIKQWARDAAAANQLDISGYDLLVCIFNGAMDYFGSPVEVVLNWNANDASYFSIDLTGVSHEVGHGLALGSHSRLEGSAAEYGDKWDIMSAYSVHYNDSGPPANPYYTFGPGLNAANMDRAGWLDPVRVYTGNGSNTYTIQLRPLHRRDLAGWLAARIQVGSDTMHVEYRAKQGWDASIPADCVLLHRQSTHPGDGRPCSELIMANPEAKPKPRPDLRSGESYEIGSPMDPFGYYARITVTAIDTANSEARVHVYVRERRRIEPAGTLYGAVTSDGAGLMWTPKRGFVKVPPRSPLLHVLELVSEYAAIQSVSSGAIADETAEQHLRAARDRLTAMLELRRQPCVPAPRLMMREESEETESS